MKVCVCVCMRARVCVCDATNGSHARTIGRAEYAEYGCARGKAVCQASLSRAPGWGPVKDKNNGPPLTRKILKKKSRYLFLLLEKAHQKNKVSNKFVEAQGRCLTWRA